LARLHGKFYGSNGWLFQKFETAFSEKFEEHIGSKAVHDDGTVVKHGVYADR
jgi:hypothetical protein